MSRAPLLDKLDPGDIDDEIRHLAEHAEPHIAAAIFEFLQIRGRWFSKLDRDAADAAVDAQDLADVALLLTLRALLPRLAEEHAQGRAHGGLHVVRGDPS